MFLETLRRSFLMQIMPRNLRDLPLGSVCLSRVRACSCKKVKFCLLRIDFHWGWYCAKFRIRSLFVVITRKFRVCYAGCHFYKLFSSLGGSLKCQVEYSTITFRRVFWCNFDAVVPLEKFWFVNMPARAAKSNGIVEVCWCPRSHKTGVKPLVSPSRILMSGGPLYIGQFSMSLCRGIMLNKRWVNFSFNSKRAAGMPFYAAYC